MFIPYTPQGILKKQLTEMENTLNFREKVRYVETLGPTIANKLCSQDPLMAPCDRENCWTCMSGEAGKCMKKGLVYIISCQTCQSPGEKSQYIGETSRASFDRGREHLLAIQKDKESPLIEHWEEAHPEVDPNFSMKIEGFYKRPLYRQTREGQLIADFAGGNLLNRRGEWGQNLPPKLEIVDKEMIKKSKEMKCLLKPTKRAAKNEVCDVLPEAKKAKNKATKSREMRKVGGG